MNLVSYTIYSGIIYLLLLSSCSKEEETVYCPAGYFPEGFQQNHENGAIINYSSNSEQFEIEIKHVVSKPSQRRCRVYDKSESCSIWNICQFQAEANGQGLILEEYYFNIAYTFWNNKGKYQTNFKCGDIRGVLVDEKLVGGNNAALFRMINDTIIDGNNFNNLYEIKLNSISIAIQDSIRISKGLEIEKRAIYSALFHNLYGIVSFKTFNSGKVFNRQID